jgi:hypothetical protein
LGEGVKLAYTPSGESGDTTTLFLSGLIGFGVGLLKGAGLLALALVTNIIHNLLPVFIFVLPLIIVGFMLAAPFVVGMTVENYVGDAISSAGCRRPGQAGAIAVLCSMIGLIVFLVVAQLVTDPGESFMFDWLLWFVRMMVGGSLTFTWLAEPELLSTSWEVIILALLGGSAALGVFSSYHTAANVVLSVPFCEQCKKNLIPENLWNVSPVQAERTIRAFQSMKYDELQKYRAAARLTILSRSPCGLVLAIPREFWSWRPMESNRQRTTTMRILPRIPCGFSRGRSIPSRWQS